MLSRRDIRKVFNENPGAAARVARANGWTRGHVSQWLSGKRQSSKVADACRAEAERLLRGEK
jgi:hypothetical protein